MYIVGMKAYDKFSNPIRNIYTFVKGPFLNIEDAEKVQEKVSNNIFENYLMAFPKGTSFLIKEKNQETTIYQLINGQRHPLITISTLFFDTHKLEEAKPNVITKELRAEANRQLATLCLRQGEVI